MKNHDHIDVLCVGEILIDFIGVEKNQSLADTTQYQRYVGGSVTNLGINLKKMGHHSAIVATMGDDGLADYITAEMRAVGMPLDTLRRVPDFPTSSILVSKSEGTPEFIAYRQADRLITADQLEDHLIEKTQIYHTTSFALSLEPARTSILQKACRAVDSGATLSIDLNYSSQIWPDKDEALRIIREYLSYGALVKISDDDAARLFGKEISETELFEILHGYGAQLISFTKGSEGVSVSQVNKKLITKAAIPIKLVADTTGAGDAFWAGFLSARLSGGSVEYCAESGLKIAAIKLSNIGKLPEGLRI